MENPLSKLALDHWYQVLMVVCVLVFLLTGAGILNAYPIGPTAMASAGGFFIGMGEWINHPLRTELMQRTALLPAGVLTSHPRSNSALGIAFDVAGLGLVALPGTCSFAKRGKFS